MMTYNRREHLYRSLFCPSDKKVAQVYGDFGSLAIKFKATIETGYDELLFLDYFEFKHASVHFIAKSYSFPTARGYGLFIPRPIAITQEILKTIVRAIGSLPTLEGVHVQWRIPLVNI